MTFTAFVLIFLSVFMHVTWNYLSKRTNPSLAFYLLMSLTASLVWLPVFLCCAPPLRELPWGFYALVLGGLSGELCYVGGLAHAYKRSDISLVYPVVRALPVMMVAAVTVGFSLGKTPPPGALWGMLIITVGCLLMPQGRFRDFSFARYKSGVIGFILLGAVGTTIYTICDSNALRLLQANSSSGTPALHALAYLFIVESTLTVGEAVLVMRSRAERVAFRELFLKSPWPLLAGLCSSGAYALVLMAMNHVSNVAYIQAFRQMSLPLGFLAGVFLLHEKSSKPKLAGMLLISVGLLLTVLA